MTEENDDLDDPMYRPYTPEELREDAVNYARFLQAQQSTDPRIRLAARKEYYG